MRRDSSGGDRLERETADIPDGQAMNGRAHVIPWYRAEDRATRDALDVQACTQCGAVLWRRETTKDKPRYPPGYLVGDDCPGDQGFMANVGKRGWVHFHRRTEDNSMAKKTGKRRGRPEQADLPGTEDSAIAPLEKAAKRYAAIRDERMELNREESALKASLITLMHKHNKTTYMRHGIEIKLVPESENVKVKIKGREDVDTNDAIGD
jgi:hypothetical protein